MSGKTPTSCFLTEFIEHERRMKIKGLKKNTTTKAVIADLEKEILSKNTGRAARKKLPLNDADMRSAPAANTDPKAYLATNWQRQGTEARLTSGDRRFPTPQPTTYHWVLASPTKQSRLVVTELLRNPAVLAWTRQLPRGAGQPRRCGRSPRPKGLTEFYA